MDWNYERGWYNRKKRYRMVRRIVYGKNFGDVNIGWEGRGRLVLDG